MTVRMSVTWISAPAATWVEHPTKRNLPRLIRQSLDDLRAVAAGGPESTRGEIDDSGCALSPQFINLTEVD